MPAFLAFGGAGARAYQHAVAHMKELSDLIQQSNAEALGLLNRRFAEAMDEVKALAEKGK